MKYFLLSLLIVLSVSTIKAEERNLRAERLEIFLSRYCPDSPLRGKGDYIVTSADYYNLDYRLYLSIAGAESTWGKKHPHKSFNYTGINNGFRRFASAEDNIDYTHMIIAEKRWYRKYRATKNIDDLVYVYKKVPPFKHYISSLRFSLDMITAVPLARPLTAQATGEIFRPAQFVVWNTTRYDHFASRLTGSTQQEIRD